MADQRQGGLLHDFAGELAGAAPHAGDPNDSQLVVGFVEQLLYAYL